MSKCECKKCVHEKVCRTREFPSIEEILKDGCPHYKDQSLFVELPCKVGTPVYVIEPLWYGIWGEDEHKCRKCEHFYEGGMGDSPDYSLRKNCCYHIIEEEATIRNLINWITPSMFTEKIEWGKTVFFTKEEAEQKLKELGV